MGVAVSGRLSRIFTKPLLAVVAAAMLADVFVVGLVVVSLQASYQQYKERAAVTSRNTNRLVATGIAGEIERIDLGLKVVGDEYLRQRVSGRIDRPSLTRFLQRQQSRLPMADGLRIVDADGNVVYGADQALPLGISVTDRDYFVALRDDPSRDLVISKPVLGKVSGKSVLIFAHRMIAADGRFAGAVIAPVTIAWFENVFAKLETGPKGAVVLRGDASRDFDLLGRFPPAGFVGQTKVSAQFKAMITANPQEGTYEAHAGADNIRRTFSYRAVGAYPLITLVGLGTDDILAGWWREVTKLTVLASVFIVLSALGGWIVMRAWNARTKAYEEIRVLNAELKRDNLGRRQAEMEVSRLNAGLEQRVRERTAELEVANKDLESFSYSVSHDLRAPLRAIAGYSQILLEDEAPRLSADGRGVLDRLLNSTVKMSTLINDILEYSRLGRRTVDLHAVDMAALVREVALHFADEYPAAQIHIGDMPPVLGDRTMLGQVLQNLIGNALKYSANKNLAEISVDTVDEDGRRVYFVRDNGVGFDMAYAGKLFGMFQRLHGDSEFPGTGVGLAIVKRLVERLGGEVWAKAAPDKGATFYFTVGTQTSGDSRAPSEPAETNPA